MEHSCEASVRFPAPGGPDSTISHDARTRSSVHARTASAYVRTVSVHERTASGHAHTFSVHARAVSVHVYSKPFDSCEIYSREKGTYFDVSLHYTSEYGRLNPDEKLL